MADTRLNRAYLSLGSNIDPEKNLPRAVRMLANFGRVVAVSRVWESAPVGRIDQPNYLNAAALLETTLTASELKQIAIPQIEEGLNRVRDIGDKNAPRTIDVDIALFNRDVFLIGSRRIPDPEIYERLFVARPLAELDPEYVHPATGHTLAQIAASLEGSTSLTARPDVSLQ